MAGIARVGDIVGKGGVLIGPFSPDVTVNGRPVALMGCVFTPHPPCSPTLPQHCFGVVIGIPEGVTVNGQIPLTRGSIATCQDPILTASSDVQIAGGLLGTVISIAAGSYGDGAAISGYERIGYTAAGQVLSGEDISQVATTAAIGAAGVAGGEQISGALVAQGASKAAAAAAAQAGVAAGTAAVTGQNVGVAVASSAVSSGVSAGTNAALGEIKKVSK